MDFLKFGLVILILGIIILGYGAIQLGDNQPKKLKIVNQRPVFLVERRPWQLDGNSKY